MSEELFEEEMTPEKLEPGAYFIDEDGALHFKLTSPIGVHGKEVDILRLRSPGVDDMAKHGILFRVDSDGDGLSIHPATGRKYMVALSGCPVSSINRMKLSDFNALLMALPAFLAD